MADGVVDFLKIGDYIVIRNVKTDSILCGDGILMDDVYVLEDSASLGSIEDAIFCLHLQRQYSAQRELEDFTESLIAEGSHLDSNKKKYLNALKRGKENEGRLNDSYMEQKVGKPILYGDVVQLLHVKSGKFVTIVPDKLATQEKENICVSLRENGSPFSWIRLVPRFKIDKEGDRILNFAEVLFNVAERPNEYVHRSERPPHQFTHREVNSSLEITSWKLTSFRSVKEMTDKNLVLPSQIVAIFDPETRSNLSLGTLAREGNFQDKIEEVVAWPIGIGDESDSNTLWVIEARTPGYGGPLTWKGGQVKFRHLNSGRYLRMVSDFISDENGMSEVFLLSTSETGNSSENYFNVHELYGATMFLAFQKALQLSQGGVYIQRGAYNEDTDIYVCRGNPEKSRATSFLIHRYAETYGLDRLKTPKFGSIEPMLDVFVGVTAKHYFDKYINRLELNFQNGTVWGENTDFCFQEFNIVLTKLINYLKGYKPQLEILITHTPVKSNIIKLRQTMFLEQGVIKSTLQLLESLKIISEKCDNTVVIATKKVKVTISNEEKAVIRVGQLLIRQSLQFLSVAILKNAPAQMFVADAMPVLLSHVGAEQQAANCVMEMLSTNMELQETKITEREVRIFTNKLRSSKMNAMYLNLLKACCSCMGKGIDGNQTTVSEILFEDTSDIFIQLHPDYSKMIAVNWEDGNAEIYIPEEMEPISPILAAPLLTKGIPQISLSWTTKSIEFSPLGLFGRLSVNIVDLYPNFSLNGAMEFSDFMKRQAGEGINEKKNAVAEYFLAELALAADMCLDRNYIAMRCLETHFPYDLLVAILKSNVNDKLRGAVVLLILRLYVDRDPQAMSRIPYLTRSFSEININGKPRLPYVDIARRNHFCLLQQILRKHIDDMRGQPWNDVSVPMMQLLKHLLMFDFYGTNEKLRDIIVPLIETLDRRRVKLDYEEESLGSLSLTRRNRKSITAENRSKTQKSGSVTINKSKSLSNVVLDNSKVDTTILTNDNSIVPTMEKCWQERTYDFLESLTSMALIIFVVFIAIGILIYQFKTGNPNPALTIIGHIITGFFCAELILRCYTTVYVKKSILPYITNWLNVVDIFVVAFDLVILALPDVGGNGGQFIKALRIVRLVRLIRVSRAARIVQKLKALVKPTIEPWIRPIRYHRTPRHEIETMIEIVTILSYIQRIIEDQNLSLLLDKFHQWTNGEDSRSPPELFEEVISGNHLSLACDILDDVFMDCTMFNDSELVQNVLDVFMAHYSSRHVLFSNIQNVQLIIAPRRERQSKLIGQMLQQLERNAETHELWGELESEEDRRISKQTFDILDELMDSCCIRRTVLEFDEDFESDREMQHLLRNLGFFDISLKILGLLPSINNIQENGPNDDDASKNTRMILRRCNNVLYWFLIDNPKNQFAAFPYLDIFLDSLDSNIFSHRVVQAMFRNNEELMKACPLNLVESFSEKVCKIGRFPQYLAVLTSITHVKDRNILANQYEIIKHLMSPGRISKMMRYCVSNTHPEYKERAAMMAPFLNIKDVSIEQLPAELAYHLEFMEVLSGCTVGRTNITTLEAKVQALYLYDDILVAMLDDQTLLLAKIKMGLLFLNAMIEVEISVSGLAQDPKVWKLMRSFVEVFKSVLSDLQAIEVNGWEVSGVSRQKVEYFVVAVMIIYGFFGKYFDLSQFDNYSKEDRSSSLTTDSILEITYDLYHSLFKIHLFKSSALSSTHKTYIKNAVETLRHRSPKLTSEYEAHKLQEEQAVETAVVKANEDEDNSEEFEVKSKFEEFLSALVSDSDLRYNMLHENRKFVENIEELPILNSSMTSDIRYEPFIIQLVEHTRNRLELLSNEKKLDARCTLTTTWVIRSFRTMIEKKWGMTIYERDDDGGEEEDEKAGPVMEALNKCGVTTLCLDLISVGIDSNLMLEAVKLCVAMLFKEGGNLAVQETMNNYLKTTDSALFFKQLRVSLQNLVSFHRWSPLKLVQEDEEPSLPEEIVLVRFMQLMCEGHYQPNQDIMREQLWNTESYNLLDDLVEYINCLSRIQCRTSTNAGTRVAATILEVIQGPCEDNQDHFALKTELIETLNRILRSKTLRDCIEDEEVELKKTCVDILQGLLEGQGQKTAVYDRVLSVIHLDVIQMICSPEEVAIQNSKHEPSEELVILRIECLVLLQMFCDYRPSLREDLPFLGSLEANAEVASVEIKWRGELQRRFFHIPKICSDLAKASKDNLVENVDRSTQEAKLVDFLHRSKELYREIKHQQWLKEWYLSTIFSRTNQNMATWISFYLACAINLILLLYYYFKDGRPILDPTIQQVVNGLNLFQLGFACFTLCLFFAVRVPVKYESNLEEGYDKIPALLLTLTDPLTVYYIIYVIVCALGTNDDIYLTFLLLDLIVKNSTARDILLAVVYPFKQIMVTYLLILFSCYIFAYVYFINFRDEFLEDHLGWCDTLWLCFKITIGRGIRTNGGMSDLMLHDLSVRYIADSLYFLIVIVILCNVIFGVIIDTFGDLREQKDEKREDTEGVCFICGIEKPVFDRAGDGTHGFQNHINGDHNMWNYLYFIIYLWEQDKDDDDGLEQFVRRGVDSMDIQWFPMGEAMCLSTEESAEEELRKELRSGIQTTESRLNTLLSQFHAETVETVENVFNEINTLAGLTEPETYKEIKEKKKLENLYSFEIAALQELPFTFDDAPMEDDLSEISGIKSLSALQMWKRLTLTIVEVNGLALSMEDLQTISVRILSEDGIFSTKPESVVKDKIIFENAALNICKQVKIDDEAECCIQILSGAGRVSQFVGILNVTYAELACASDLLLEKTFNQNGINKLCTISMIPTAFDLAVPQEDADSDVSDDD